MSKKSPRRAESQISHYRENRRTVAGTLFRTESFTSGLRAFDNLITSGLSHTLGLNGISYGCPMIPDSVPIECRKWEAWSAVISWGNSLSNPVFAPRSPGSGDANQIERTGRIDFVTKDVVQVAFCISTRSKDRSNALVIFRVELIVQEDLRESFPYGHPFTNLFFSWNQAFWTNIASTAIRRNMRSFES